MYKSFYKWHVSVTKQLYERVVGGWGFLWVYAWVYVSWKFQIVNWVDIYLLKVA